MTADAAKRGKFVIHQQARPGSRSRKWAVVAGVAMASLVAAIPVAAEEAPTPNAPTETSTTTTAPADPSTTTSEAPPTTAQPEPKVAADPTVSTADDGDVSAAVAAQLEAIAQEKESRTPAEQKLDSNLVYAVNQVTEGEAVDGAPALRSSVPTASGDALVDFDADVTPGLLDAIKEAGGHVVASVPGFDAVRAEVPLDQVVELASRDDVRAVRPADRATTNRSEPEPTGGPKPEVPPTTASEATTSSVGAGINEADVTHAADTTRTGYGVDGTGVKVCVLSDGVNTLAARQATGDLPAVDVLPGQAGSGDEGTAMLELIHDIAPGAELGFATAFSGVSSFAQNIINLEADGCDVIVDDVTYYSEPTLQDGPIAQAITTVRNAGAIYFSSAGNSGNLPDATSGTWQGDFDDENTSLSPLPMNLRVHGWGQSGITYNALTSGGSVINLQWSDPLGASSNDYDLYLLAADGLSVLRSSTNVQNGSQNPAEQLTTTDAGGNLVSPPTGSRVIVTKSQAAASRYLVLYTNRGRLTYGTGGAARGHNVSLDAVSVAATPASVSAGGSAPTGPYPGTHTGTNTSELFSSDGPTRQYFNPNGTAITPGNFSSSGGVGRNGVDITAADGVTTTTPGFTRFFGTSAAAPNAAALAALALEAKPTLTPLQLENALGASATDIEAAGFDPVAGAGIVMGPALMTAIGVAPKAKLVGTTRTVTPSTVGDADAYVEPGETATITQTLRNDGGGTATSVTATLVSNSANATVTQGSVTYSNIAAGGSATPNSLPFKIQVANNCPCGTSLPFTLTVSYAGGLQSSLTIPVTVTVGQPGTQTTATYAGSAVAIPDNNATGASATVAVASTAKIQGVTVTIAGSSCNTTAGSSTVGIDHTFVGDLTLTLTSPTGTTVPLMQRAGGSGNNICQAVFSDAAANAIQSATSANAPFTGSWKPAGTLADFVGQNPQGTWTLKAVDASGNDTGSIRAFSVTITTFLCNYLNAAPVGGNDTYGVAQGATLNVSAPGVLGNDTDADSDPLTASLVANVTHGSLTLNSNGSFSYTPTAGYNGQDLFIYRPNDGKVNGANTSVTINVNGTPTAVADSYKTSRNTALVVPSPGVLGNDSDPESQAMTAVVGANPTHGTLSLNANGSFTYTPTTGYTGPDSFTYRASDGTTSSALQTVSLQVNAPPTAVAESYNVTAGTTFNLPAPGVLGNDSDPEGDPFTAVLVANVAHGSLSLNANGSFAYAPTSGYTGGDSFTYKAVDAWGSSATVTVTLTVGAANAAPTATADAYAVPRNTAINVPAPGILGNDSDPDGNPITAQLVGNVSHGTLSLNANGSFTYTPTTNYSGPDSFTYKASDGTLTSGTTTVSLTVNGAPTSTADSYVARRNTALNVSAPGILGNDSDPDGNPITAQLVGNVSHGTLSLNANGSFTYTPTTNYSGPDSFTYKASDGTATSGTTTVSITVNALPVAAADSYSVSAGNTLNVAAPGVLGNDTDVEGDPLTVSLVAGVTHGSLTLNPNGSFAYTPTSGYTGGDSFTYKANDATGSSSTVTVSLTVTAANAAPTAVADSYFTPRNTAITVPAPGVLGNDSDPESSPLTASLVATVSHGTLSLNANGSFTYTPATNYSGTDSFTYKASDGLLSSATQTVTLTINGAPTGVADSYTTVKNTAKVVAAPGVLGNDTDPEGNSLTAMLVASVSHGTLSLNANGGFTYTPTTGYTGGDSFTYRAKDATGQSAVTTVTLTVTNANASPTATGDSYRVVAGKTLTKAAPGVLGNDTDPESDPLTAALVANVAHGTLSLNANGGFTYTPTAGYTGTDSFTYRASDGSTQSATTTVNILVITPIAAYVDAIYGDFLDRVADSGGMAYWGGRLERGAETRSSFVLKMARSHEYAVKIVTRTFNDVLGRNPDPSGREYWANRVQNGMAPSTLYLQLMSSSEFLNNVGGSVGDYVDAAYQAILGRAPDAAGRQSKINAINGGKSRLSVALEIYNSTESRRRRVRAQYQYLLGRQPNQAELDTWIPRLATKTDTDLAVALGASQEYFDAASNL